MDDFKGKKILITQNALHYIAGSELATLELATFFKDRGAKVSIFTWYTYAPMRTSFEKQNIEIITDENDKHLNDNFDIIWVHHQVIPKKILEKLYNNTCRSKFIFYHMSPLKELALEQPYLYDLEAKIANLVLFTSKGTEESLIESFPSLKRHFMVLENFVPNNYLEYKYSRDSLQKILVVSNHPPKEVLSASKQLKNLGYEVDIIGRNFNAEIITAKKLVNYDLVITIGKTVPYCLCIGVPVYIYDHFGGPGFLSAKNFKKARFRTFSGRNFKKKSASIIVKEITSYYHSALQYQQKNLGHFVELFLLDNQIIKVFKSLDDHTKAPISLEEYNKILAILSLAKDKVNAENNLLTILHDMSKTIQEQQSELTRMGSEYKKIINSKKFRFLSKLSRILHPFSSS